MTKIALFQRNLLFAIDCSLQQEAIKSSTIFQITSSFLDGKQKFDNTEKEFIVWRSKDCQSPFFLKQSVSKNWIGRREFINNWQLRWSSTQISFLIEKGIKFV